MPRVDGTASKRMAATRGKDNPREVAIRSALHRLGFRFRIHRRLIPGSMRTVDIVFGRIRLAIFLDGCFWHACPQHSSIPKTNTDWWTAKLQANIERDRSTTETLERAGWTVLRIWEHVPLSRAVELISTEVCLLKRANS
jgi:DNA mismatch endonuclease (patch repair protein)